jgi:hypothetical protein
MLFPSLDPPVKTELERLLSLIDNILPVPGRFRSRIPSDVAECSRLLTSGRTERDGGYLGRPNLLSAYLRYFLPWNVFRLCRLFAGHCSGTSNPLGLNGGDAITDLGSGPLTLPLALWAALPELRSLQLEFRCIDRTGTVLEAGKNIFDAFRGTEKTWTIKAIRGPLETKVYGKKAKLVAAINVLNENGSLGADRTADLLMSRCAEDGSILVLEPGVPQSGVFVTALRSALQRRGGEPLLPCTHAGSCPLEPRPGEAGMFRQGGKAGKWCHFAFGTDDAPEALRRLSAAAGLPKERAVLSFLLSTGPRQGGNRDNASPGAGSGTEPRRGFPVRIFSDAFPVAEKWGRYGCSEMGLVLVTGGKKKLFDAASGTVLVLPGGITESGIRRDRKSGALLFEIPG